MYSAMIGAAILARAQRRELLSREDFPRTCKIKHARHGGPSNAIFRGRGKTSIDRRFEFRRSCSCKRRTVLKQPEVAARQGVDLRTAALQFGLAGRAVTDIAVGARKANKARFRVVLEMGA
jgi:hypothetical protein